MGTKYKRIATTGYTRPVTVDDGPAAGCVIHIDSKRIANGLVRVRRTASNGRHSRWSTEDMTSEEYYACYGSYCERNAK